MTHHAPSPRSLDPAHLRDPVAPCYASDLEALMRGPNALALWVHSHVHASLDYAVGHTRVLCNPRGMSRDMPHLPRKTRAGTWK